MCLLYHKYSDVFLAVKSSAWRYLSTKCRGKRGACATVSVGSRYLIGLKAAGLKNPPFFCSEKTAIGKGGSRGEERCGSNRRDDDSPRLPEILGADHGRRRRNITRDAGSGSSSGTGAAGSGTHTGRRRRERPG